MVFTRVLIVLFLFTSYFGFTQDNVMIEVLQTPKMPKKEIKMEVSFINYQQAPIYPGCENLKTQWAKSKCLQKGIRAHVAKHFNMDLANELNLAPGRKRIIGIFKIDKKGDVTNITAKAPHPKLKEEAIRMMKKLPRMIPGKYKGQPITIKYGLPIVVYVKELTKEK